MGSEILTAGAKRPLPVVGSCLMWLKNRPCPRLWEEPTEGGRGDRI